MFSERVTVSRKTPADGKLEVSRAAAEALGLGAQNLPLVVDGRPGRATVSAMECTCAKAERTGVHVHYFLEAEPLKTLTPGRTVEVRRLEDGTVEATSDTA